MISAALRGGLKGRAPAGATEATWALEDTAATHMLSPTAATSALPRTGTAPHRRLEPLDEPAPPRRAPARRQPAPPPPRKKKGGSGARLFVALLVVLALVVGGLVAYQAANGSSSKSVQLRQDVKGQVNDAIEQLYKDKGMNASTMEFIATIAPLYADEKIFTGPTGRLLISKTHVRYARHLLKPRSGKVKQVYAGEALEAVLAAAQRPPSNEDSRTDHSS